MTSLYELDKNSFNAHNYSIIVKNDDIISYNSYYKKIIQALINIITKENLSNYGPQLLLLALSYIKPFSPTITIITSLYKIWKEYKNIKEKRSSL